MAVETAEAAAVRLRTAIDAEIEREKRQQSEDQRALAVAAKHRQTHAYAMFDAAVDRALLDTEELLERGSSNAYHDWDSDVWVSKQPLAVQAPHVVRLATLGIGSARGICELPFVLPALGSSLVITHDPSGRATANMLAQSYVVRALAASIPGSLRVHVLDPGGLGQNVGILSRLPEPLGTGGVRATHDEVSGELQGVRDHIHRLNSQVLLGDSDSLVSRWYSGSANGIPCSLVLAAGLSTGLTSDDAHQLWAIARTGHRCGVSVVAVVDTSRALPQGVALSDLIAHAHHVHVDTRSGITWESAPPDLRDHVRIRIVNAPAEPQYRFFTDILAPAAREGANQPVLMGDLLRGVPLGGGSTVTTIAAPIGRRADGSPIDLAVGDEEGTAIGGLLVGPSGSGKTTLLHTFIHALAYRYPPDELELYLLDMKDGVEFAEYAPRPGRPALPHVRAVGIETDPSFALGVLNHLVEVDRHRKHLFKEASIKSHLEIKNIAQYREFTGETLPRVLFVADEFQLMLAGPTEDAAWDTLDLLAKQGRSQGIHVLLATQSMASVGVGRGMQKASVFDQLELRVGLRCKVDELSRLLDRPVRNRLDTGRRGSGVLNHSRGDLDADQIFQAGILESHERGTIRDMLVTRHQPNVRVRVSRGTGGVEISDVAEILSQSTSPTLYVGAPVGVEPPIVGVTAQSGDGRGLLLTSRDEIQGIGAISAMLAGLALQPPCADAGFVVVDLLPPGIPGRSSLNRLVHWLGDRVVTVTDDQLHTLPAVASRAPGPTFVALLGLQYTAAEVPYYNDASGPPHPFSWLCGQAPSHNIFPLIWLDLPDRIRKLGPDAGRLQLRADAGTDIINTASFLERRPPFAAPRGRMWFHDLAGQGEPVLLDPFRFSGQLPPGPAGASRGGTR